jgi:hypothetical protein
MKTKFNFHRGTATKKGTPIKRTRLISEEHSLYPYLFAGGMPVKKEEAEEKLKTAPENIRQLARDEFGLCN